MNKHIVIGSSIAFAVASFLLWNHTSTIKVKNELERARIDSTERLKLQELSQEKELADRKLNRELEEDCQEQIKAIRYRANNIEGGGYNVLLGYCEVSYRDTETKEIERGDIKGMVSVE